VAGSGAAQAQPLCLSFSFMKRKVQDTGARPCQATVPKGNSPTTVPSLPHTQGFQPLKAYKQAVLSHPHSKAFGILCHSICQWPRNTPTGSTQHQAFTAPGSRPARALLLGEHYSTSNFLSQLGLGSPPLPFPPLLFFPQKS